MSWQEELKTSVKSFKELKSYLGKNSKFVNYLEENKDFDDVKYPVFIPLKILEKIIEYGPESALGIQFLPSVDELTKSGGHHDPIGDSVKKAAPQLVHRYKNRALFLPTSKCPINCRYCFRKNEIHSKDTLFDKDFDLTVKYLKEHSEINEVIFSGGDPLLLSDKQIKKYLKEFEKIKSIEVIRFHTRFPIVIPSRVNNEFIDILKPFKEKFNIIFVIHANHIDEFNSDVKKSLTQLSDLFLTLSQSVLLKDVNNTKKDLKNLFREFTQLNIKPYYLHYPDDVLGAQHFRVDKQHSSNIFNSLRSEISGWMLPSFVEDNVLASGKMVLT